MKQSLQLKLSQHLTLTPQLQQSIRLLQLSTQELNQEIEKFLHDNPLLERAEEPEDYGQRKDFNPSTSVTTTSTTTSKTEETPREQESQNASSSSSSSSDSDQDWFKEGGAGSYGTPDDGEDNDYPQMAADTPSLREHLIWQLNLIGGSARDKNLVTVLIECLDDDGYLTLSLDEVIAMLPAELEVDVDELQVAIRQLQSLEPPGIGARSLSECLSLQLDALPEDVPFRQESLIIVKDHLELLAARDYAKLKKVLKCDDNTLRGVQHLVISLNPRPGGSYTKNETRYVVPDVVVRKIKGVWRVSLNPDAMPKLRVNRLYADILHRNRDASLQQLSGQLQEAKWLIKNVQQRFDTILRVSQAIVDRQRHFFEHGEVAMKPLVLREIAEILGLHESTVSRVTTQKFMLTPRGIFELKYFFGSHVSTETGGACSATAIRALIKQLVGEEDTRKPLSDSQISEILGKQGIVVARRTIAKYRESLQILPVNLRKSI